MRLGYLVLFFSCHLLQFLFPNSVFQGQVFLLRGDFFLAGGAGDDVFPSTEAEPNQRPNSVFPVLS